ncbi:MAG TPA: DinB family protein [Actinoplanes sp.]|nr:DinB family protein [Actinoplanes sp.]
MTIIPDAKDWTWVLQRQCPECGFRADSFPREAIPALLRANVDHWRTVFADSADLGVRPSPDKWSPLEYGCHVRDVFRLYAYRLQLMLTEVDPAYPNWDQDATAVADRYGEQDPATVASELAVAGDQLAAAFEAVHGDQWLRTGNRSDGARFTVDSFARYLLHDPVHHLYDVTGRRST